MRKEELAATKKYLDEMHRLCITRVLRYGRVGINEVLVTI